MYNEQQDVGGFIYIYIYFFLQWAFKSFKLPQGGGFVCFFLFLLRPCNLIVRIRLQTHVFKRLLIISNNEKTRTYRLTSADVPCLLSQPMHARSTCCRCTQKQKNKQMLFVVGPSSSSLSLLFLHDFFFLPPEKKQIMWTRGKKRGEMQNNHKPLDKRIWQIVSCLICSWRLHVILLKPLIRAEEEFFCPHIVWAHQGGWLLLRSLLLCHKVDFIGNWKIPTVTPVFDNFTPLHYEKTGSVGITCII